MKEFRRKIVHMNLIRINERGRLVAKGSYTIEASFLLPMILTVIVLLLYMGFFLHDRAILNSAAYTSALRGSQLISGEDIYSEIEKSSKKLIENRLLATRSVATDIEIKGSSITVSYQGDIRIPAGALLCKYLNNGRREIEVKAMASAKCQNAVKFIRQCRVVGNIVDKVK